MRLRPATLADATSIARIYGEEALHGLATFEETAPSADEMAARMKPLLDGGFPFLIAQIGADVAGYAYASPWNERTGYRFAVQDSIYIDAAFRRRGLGKALLSALIERSKDAGKRQMMAIIGGASDGSIALHREAGFVEIGRARTIAIKFNRWLDVVYMQRGL